MFLVVTTPNARDTNVAIFSPRLITEDSEKAFSEARKACTDKDSVYVSNVIVYELTVDRAYTLEEAKYDRGNMVYIATYSVALGRWHEDLCEGSFARFA